MAASVAKGHVVTAILAYPCMGCREMKKKKTPSSPSLVDQFEAASQRRGLRFKQTAYTTIPLKREEDPHPGIARLSPWAPAFILSTEETWDSALDTLNCSILNGRIDADGRAKPTVRTLPTLPEFEAWLDRELATPRFQIPMRMSAPSSERKSMFRAF